MLHSLVFINVSVFIAIAALHVYWAAGGRKWTGAVLPATAGEGKKLFMPGKLMTLAVAAGLLFFAFISLGAISIFSNYLSDRFFVCGNAVVGAIFMLRAVGDFKFAGLFKKVKDTLFAKNDTRYFTPLCTGISIIAFLISFILYSA